MEGKVLVTGGAGYIGSHLVKNLLKKNYQVVVLDDLSTGFIEAIEILQKKFPDKLEFIKINLENKKKLTEVFQQRNIDAVMHLAAKIDVTEAVKNPNLYHQTNYINSINLLDAMLVGDCQRLIFSSTAAVYGNPKYTPIDESHPTNPTNPYGQTKLDFEKYLQRIENLKFTILRYFNVGGSDPEGLLGKSHINLGDLLENIMKVALGGKEVLEIFGSDYPTVDGTPVRDFIHVEDICQAHILALEKKDDSEQGGVFNLGSETGFTVKEIVDKASLVVGKEIPTVVKDRRPGDIAISVASAKKAKEILGWHPEYSDLGSIISTDWNWRKNSPLGYSSYCEGA